MGYWELNTVFIGTFGTTALAAHTSVQSMQGVFIVVISCVTGACTTMISRAFGAGNVRQARLCSMVSFGIICSMWIIPSFFFLVLSHTAGKLFNSHPEALQIMYTLLHVSGCSGFFICAQMVAGSILRSVLKYRLVACVQMFNLYIFALPLGVLLAFRGEHGIFGIYNGFLCGLALSSVSLIAVVVNLDFESMSQEIGARLKEDMAKGKGTSTRAPHSGV